MSMDSGLVEDQSLHWECTYMVCLEEKLSEASWSFYLALSASDAYPASMYIISANRIA